MDAKKIVKAAVAAAALACCAMGAMAQSHYAMRLFLDYNLQPAHSRGSKEWMNTLTAGTSFAIAF